MNIIVDESVSFGVVIYLINLGYNVIAVAETETSGMKDSEVFDLVKKKIQFLSHVIIILAITLDILLIKLNHVNL
jgi:hypothetical protein